MKNTEAKTSKEIHLQLDILSGHFEPDVSAKEILDYADKKWFPESYVQKLEADLKQYKGIALERRIELEKVSKTALELSKYTKGIEEELATAKQERDAFKKQLGYVVEDRDALHKAVTEAKKILNETPSAYSQQHPYEDNCETVNDCLERLRVVLKGETKK